MPTAWSKKDERQYQHILDSERDKPQKVAKQIAAATVNKQRNAEGRTKEQQATNRESTYRKTATRRKPRKK